MNEEYPQGGNKSQWPGQVDSLIRQAEAGSEEAIAHLMCWLQDMNWPGANKASNYLILQGDRTLARVVEILTGSDTMWKYWTINELIGRWPRELTCKVTPLLVDLTNKDDGSEVNLSAAELLCRNCLCPRDELLAILDRVKGFDPLHASEIEAMEKSLR